MCYVVVINLLCTCYGLGRAHVYLVFRRTVLKSAKDLEKARRSSVVSGVGGGGGNQAFCRSKRVAGERGVHVGQGDGRASDGLVLAYLHAHAGVQWYHYLPKLCIIVLPKLA